jgi:bacterial/archaeal transporter family protein
LSPRPADSARDVPETPAVTSFEKTSSTAIAAVPAKHRVPAWLIYSILTLLFWGIWGATSKAVSDDIDAYTNQVFFGIGMVPLVLLVAFSPRLKGGVQRRQGIFFAFATGILGGTGNIAFFRSLMTGGKASVVVPATSLSPLVTVLMGYFILKERLTGVQKLGFILALVAIYLLSL